MLDALPLSVADQGPILCNQGLSQKGDGGGGRRALQHPTALVAVLLTGWSTGNSCCLGNQTLCNAFYKAAMCGIIQMLPYHDTTTEVELNITVVALS